MSKLPQKYVSRQAEITNQYLDELDKHIRAILAGTMLEMYEIRDFARILCIHPVHLSNTVRLHTGKSPCAFCVERLMDESKKMLDSPMSITAIATTLLFDPSNFTKFFKRFAGVTPSQYRQQLLANTALHEHSA